MRYFIPILIVLLSLIGCKEKEHAEVSIEKPDNLIEYSMVNNANLILENPEINSISIGIYKDGKTYIDYYGEIDKGKNNLPNDNTLFEIASVTKSFTGIIVAQAVLDGKFKPEDDIRTYLDGSFPNLEYDNRPIQIRDLLTHTSGIRRDFGKPLENMFSVDLTEAEKNEVLNYDREALVKDLKAYKLDTIPGIRYDYSPVVAAEIVALILEKVYDKPYLELLDEHVLSRAGLSQTKMTLTSFEAKNLVNSYTDIGELAKQIPIPMTGAGAGLKSTIPDLTKYIKYLLETDDPVIKEMQKSLFYDEEDDESYGYFWKLGDDGSFMHNGGTHGSTNWVIILPEVNAGFAVMFNSNGDESGDLINEIANKILDDLERYPKKNPYFSVRKEILENTDKGMTLYKQLKEEQLEDFDFSDSNMLNVIGYELLRNEQNEDAITVFKLLVSEFPNLGNPYDSLGEAYYINEQYDLSLKNYKKAFELNPENEYAQEMIDELNNRE